MFSGFKLKEEFVQFEENVLNWEEAIKKSASPLLKNGYINQSYIDAMIESVHEYGPYIVITPYVALPHARPETGSIKMGYSILKLEKSVPFSDEEEHQVRLLIALSCVDANTHMEVLQGIVTVLSDEEKFKKLMKAKSHTEIVSVFS